MAEGLAADLHLDHPAGERALVLDAAAYLVEALIRPLSGEMGRLYPIGEIEAVLF